MFDDGQNTPNDLVCAFKFSPANGKRRMISFEVRHWMTNNEASIGTPDVSNGDRNPIVNIFYGSKGYMATGDEGGQYVQGLAWEGAAAAAERP